MQLAKFNLIVAVGVVLSFVATSGHAALSRAQLLDTVVKIHYAYYTGATKDLVEMTRYLEDQKPRAATAKWQKYYTAYGYYRAATLAGDDFVTEYLGRCESITKSLIRAERGFVEALILRGACAAYLAEKRPISAVLAPSRAVKAFARAGLIDEENPRLLLSQASAAIGRRAFAAEYSSPVVLLESAIEAFESRQDADPLTPDWGEVEAHIRLATLLLDAGERRRARDSIEQALQFAPDYQPAQQLMQKLRSGE